MRKFLCQKANVVTREENSKVAFESHYRKNSIRTPGKQTNKQTNKKQNKGPANKVSNFQEAAGGVDKIRNMEHSGTSRNIPEHEKIRIIFMKKNNKNKIKIIKYFL